MTMERNSLMGATAYRDERFDALKRLYPELVRDGKLDVGALRELFGEEAISEGEMGYNLYWPGKREAKKLARKEAEGTLEPVPGDGVNEETTQNIYIEGDNLEVLRILRKSYAERVKMIYIDPPYNTGKDFIYPDNYREPVDDYLKFIGEIDEKGVSLVANPKSGGAYHRRWLGMMLPRLQLARELLAKDGVIFISIDDNEQANLKLLCDEVFGEENFVAEFIWKNRNSLQHDECLVSKQTERILFYVTDKSIWNYDNGYKLNRIRKPFDATEYKNPDNDPRGPWLSSGKTRNDGRPSYTVVSPAGVSFTKPWIPSPKEFEKWEKEGLIWWGKDGSSIPRKKAFLKDFKGNAISDILFDEYTDEVKNENSLKRIKRWEIGTTESGTKGEKILFDGIAPFDYPKPWTLIKYLISIAANPDALILDFFSGSATTAHACMQLNAEDGGKRKYIMVQLPVECEPSSAAAKAGFKNICEIGKERIRRAGQKILGEHPERQGTLDIGFKVYRLAKSNIKPYTPTTGSDETALELALGSMESQITPLRDGFDFQNSNDIRSLLTEILLRQGFALDSHIEKSTSVAGNVIYRIIDEKRPVVLNVCLDRFIEKETVQGIAFGDNDKFVCLNSAISDEIYAQLSDKGRVETL